MRRGSRRRLMHNIYIYIDGSTNLVLFSSTDSESFHSISFSLNRPIQPPSSPIQSHNSATKSQNFTSRDPLYPTPKPLNPRFNSREDFGNAATHVPTLCRRVRVAVEIYSAAAAAEADGAAEAAHACAALDDITRRSWRRRRGCGCGGGAIGGW